jgi:DNA-directed RNA polymerase II subunit RPB1
MLRGPAAEPELVVWGVPSAEGIAQQAHKVITSPVIAKEGKPDPDGPHSLYLGTNDYEYRCQSCFNKKRTCSGHMGVLVLPENEPVLNPLTVGSINDVLRVICWTCGRLLVDIREVDGSKGIMLAKSRVKDGAGCKHCGSPSYKAVRDKENPTTFKYRNDDDEEVTLTSQQIFTILKRIKPQTVKALGLPIGRADPRNYVIHNVPYPPSSIRPGVAGVVPNSSPNHALTVSMQYFTTAVEKAKEATHVGDTLSRYYYSMTLSSAKTARTTLAGAPAMAILENLPGKHRRIRRNELGKRVLVIARNTIAGNSDLEPDQVLIPKFMAQVLFVSETVQPFNYERLMTYVQNGSNYPGCSGIWKKNYGTFHLQLPPESSLDFGDVVYRNVIEDDQLFFNRAPTLERSSLIVMRAVVNLDPAQRTFQLNVIACPFFNADFDGDQMTVIGVHGPAPRVEAQMLVRAPRFMISSSTGAPVLGEIQDAVVGSALATRTEATFSRLSAQRMFANIAPTLKKPLFDDREYPGRELFSSLFADNMPIYYTGKAKYFDEALEGVLPYTNQNTRVEIRQGVLTQGVLDKGSIGDGKADGPFDLISRRHGSDRAFQGVFSVQQMAASALHMYGFTISAHDFTLSLKYRTAIAAIRAAQLERAAQVTQQLVQGKLVAPIGTTTRDYYERRMVAELHGVPDQVYMEVINGLRMAGNGLVQMILYGGKGNKNNLMHIAGYVSQVVIDGQRPSNAVGGRTSIYSQRFSLDPRDNGFVENCYAEGINVLQLVPTCQNARFDLISKALLTAVAGTFTRSSVMSLQTLCTDIMRKTVCGSTPNRVVQFLYGEDGLDVRKLENATFKSAGMSDEELREVYHYEGGTPDQKQVFDDEFAEIVEDRKWFRKWVLRFQYISPKRPAKLQRKVAVDVIRVLEEVQNERVSEPVGDDPVALAEMVKYVAEEVKNIPYVFMNAACRDAQVKLPPQFWHGAKLMMMQLRTVLSAKTSLKTLDMNALQSLLETVKYRYSTSLIEYGSAVGIISAQAISSPLTQYMLDSHHRSVTGGTSKAGLVRSKEVFEPNSKNTELSTKMILRLHPEYAHDEAVAQSIANKISQLKVTDFVKSYSLLFERFESLVDGKAGYSPAFEADRNWCRDFLKHHPAQPPPSEGHFFCFRLVLDRTFLIHKGVSLELIVRKIRRGFPPAIVVHTSENMPEVVLRIYWNVDVTFTIKKGIQLEQSPHPSPLVEKAQRSMQMVLNHPVRGIEDITDAKVLPLKTEQVVRADGSLGVSERPVYAIETEGSNYFAISQIRQIDVANSSSTSILDTARTFGICAARLRVLTEIKEMMLESPVNPRHPLIYADVETSMARLTSLKKTGIELRENNPLLHMALSHPIQHLVSAVVRAKHCNVQGSLSGPLMLGRPPNFGTSYSRLTVNEDMLNRSITFSSIIDDL